MERELVDDVPGHAQYHVIQNKQSVRFSKSVGCYSKLLVSYKSVRLSYVILTCIYCKHEDVENEHKR